MKTLYKVILLLVLLASEYISVNGQTLYHFNQYMLNNYIANPAIVGTYNHYRIKTNYRYQWIGDRNGPQTIHLCMYGPLKKYDMGYGFYIYNDNVGPTSYSGIMGTYGYNFPVAEDYHISFAASIGVMQYKLDGSILNNLADPFDPLIPTKQLTKYKFDANFGAYFYSSNLYAGYSVFQLFGNKMQTYDSEKDTSITIQKLVRHFNLVAGYLLILNKNLWIEPSMILMHSPMYKRDVNTSILFEIGGKVTLERKIWFGATWKGLTGASLLFGYLHEKKYEFGLSYEYDFNKYGFNSSGTVELMIGYRFLPIK